MTFRGFGESRGTRAVGALAAEPIGSAQPDVSPDVQTPATTLAPAPPGAEHAPGIGARVERPDAAADPDGERVLVVGPEARTMRVRRRLEEECGGLTGVVTAVSITEAARWISTEPFELVVLVAPVRGATLEHALSLLRACGEDAAGTAYVVLVSEGFSQDRTRSLHERGARAVLRWPVDLPALAEMASVTLESARRLPVEALDEALRRAVRERLRKRLRRFARGLGIEIRDGVATLSGRVSSLWAKLALAKHAAECPGIDEVVTDGLRVDAPEREDEAIGREIRAVLDGSVTIDSSTLGVTVHDGRVVLLGCVLDHEREHVLELLAMVPGVRSVSDRSSASPADKKRSRTRARRLQAKLSGLGRGAGLRVAVVGPTAVLRGVGSPSEIREAQELLQRWTRASDTIQRVLHRAGPRMQPPTEDSR